MSGKTLPLVIGVGEDGRLLPIRRAKRGLRCKCTCPACGAQLSAKKGKIKAHHFAHFQRKECEGAIETALHRFGKAVLLHHRAIITPPIRVYRMKKPARSPRSFCYQSVDQEVGLEGVVADIVLSGEEKMVVEFKVSHAVEPYKQRIFIRAGIPALEIDLLTIFTELVQEGLAHDTKELARRIINFGNREQGLDVHGRWLFHPLQHQIEYKRRQRGKRLKVSHRKWRGHHYYETQGCPCPMRQRITGGKGWTRTYARAHQDCIDCPHLVEYDYHYCWVGYHWLPTTITGVICGYPLTSGL